MMCNLEQTASVIGLFMNSDKTEFIGFKQKMDTHLHIKLQVSEICRPFYIPR